MIIAIASTFLCRFFDALMKCHSELSFIVGLINMLILGHVVYHLIKMFSRI